MSKVLVAYFSATGRTAKAAKLLAEAADADLYEIRPEIPYAKKDLNWLNPLSRSSKEMRDRASRPPVAKDGFSPAAYDVIFLGFPIWWYVAPTVINTFLESFDFSGKQIVLFATSGSSGLGKSAERLRPSAPGAELADGRMLNGVMEAAELKSWVNSVISEE